MSSRRHADVEAQASVFLGERLVGTRDYRNGDCSFSYGDLEPGHPVLGLRFEDDPAYGRRVTYGGVPVWFANLLPERESGLRRMINASLGRYETHDFHLLVLLGGDLPGAVRVQPAGDLPSDMPVAVGPEGPGEGSTPSFSLSGMQLKFSMASTGDGFAVPPQGEIGDWIVKLPSQVHSDLPANEHATMRWAAHVGIDVPEHRLVQATALSGLPEGIVDPATHAFAIRRFDRTVDGRVHQEDFAQILDVRPADKGRGTQELLAQIVSDVCPDGDVDELVRRIVFCVAAGNTDEHLKNWSLQYPDGRQARISPAYDLVSATSYPAFRRNALTLSIGGQTDIRYLRLDHFRRLADESGLDAGRVVDVVKETIGRVRSSWHQILAEPTLPPFMAAHVTDRLAALPLLRGE